MTSSNAYQQIVNQKIKIDPIACIGCGTCVDVCPFMVYEMKKGKKGKKIAVPAYQEDCFLCQSCQAQCPTDAIRIEW